MKCKNQISKWKITNQSSKIKKTEKQQITQITRMLKKDFVFYINKKYYS